MVSYLGCEGHEKILTEVWGFSQEGQMVLGIRWFGARTMTPGCLPFFRFLAVVGKGGGTWGGRSGLVVRASAGDGPLLG